MAKQCPECKGKRAVRCDRCNGTGTFFPLPVLGVGGSRCQKCNGSGKLSCPKCGGSGKA
jgi:DnaJ-class molecular chaperone